MSQYRFGTVQVTNNSTAIVGDTSAWSTNASAGDLFMVVGDGVTYEIASVTDDTHLTLNTKYQGTSRTGQSYVIARDFTPNLNLPYIQRNDIETATILKAQALKLDSTINLDTSIDSPTAGQALTYNGTTWVNADVTAVGTITDGSWQADWIGIGYGGTGLTTTPANGQVLIGNGTDYTLATIAAGTALSVTNASGSITLDNTGVTSNVAGTGISVSGATGAVTISNTGVTSAVAGTGIGVSSASGDVTISNTGVTSLSGTTNQVTVSESTGAVTLSLPQNINSGATPTFAEITITGTPTNSTDVATKAYVDATAAGLTVKASVIAASTTNVTVSSPGTDTFDGITLTSGQRILLKNQTTASENGIYTFAASGSALTRASDFSTGTTFSGSMVFVEEGSTQASTVWVVTTDDPITLGTTSVAWTQFGASADYSAGTGLSLTGMVFANTGVTSVSGTTNQISASASTGGVTLGIDSGYVGQTSITTLGTIGTGVWHGTGIDLTAYVSGVLPAANGGTGVDNGTSTITLGGNLTTSGSYATTLTVTGDTSVTLPTSGTLITSAVTTLSDLVSVGTITTGTWNGTAVAAGYGGTGQTTYTVGDILYADTTTTLAKLSAGTSGYLLQSNGAGVAPTWADLADPTLFADPTNTVGLSAVNGTATTVMRSDSAPALDVSIAPTWTGLHTFSESIVIDTDSALALVNAGSGNNGGFEISGNGNTAGTSSLFVGQNSLGNAYLLNRADSYLYIGTDSISRVEISGDGNIVITAPSSGQTLSISSASGGHAISIDSSVLSSSVGIPTYVMDSSGSDYGYMGNVSSNLWCLGYGTSATTYGTAALTWNGSGNVSIPAPASGYPLTLTGGTSGSKLFAASYSGGATLYGYADSGGSGITNSDPYTSGSLVYLSGESIGLYCGSTSKATINSAGLTVNGSTGAGNGIYCNGGDITAARSSNTGVVYFGTGGAYWYFDGSKMNLSSGSGGLYTDGSLVSGGAIYPGTGSQQTSWYIEGNGSYGLYTNTGFYIAGPIYCASTVYGSYSDSRLKNVQGPITGALDKICSLNGFTFTPNEKALKYSGDKDKLYHGVSAQEVQAIFPELIENAPLNDAARKDGDDSEYMTIDYARLVPALIEAIKELRAELKQLKQQVGY